MTKFLSTIAGGLLLFMGGIVFAGLFFSLPVMLLWNYCLVPAIPGIKLIGWLQAWGILFLCGCLFKSSNSQRKEK
jgi:hypothetical protein